jgi:hypothetical protein
MDVPAGRSAHEDGNQRVAQSHLWLLSNLCHRVRLKLPIRTMEFRQSLS